MPTIHNIALSVIQPQTIKEKPFFTREVIFQSRTYQVLMSETTAEIIEKVKAHVTNKAENFDALDIGESTAHAYLAAAKIVDLTVSDNQRLRTTYKIRERCVLITTDKNKRGAINVLNAFSMPPIDKENIDSLLAVQLNHNHPAVRKAQFGEERDGILRRVYGYCQKEAEIIPEIATIIEKIIRKRFITMHKVDQLLPIKTVVFYKGCSGSGKTHAQKNHSLIKDNSLDPIEVIQSTDHLKRDIQQELNNVFDDEQVHLIGFSAFKMLSEVMMAYYSKLSTIQEGWLNSNGAINGLFNDLRKNGLNLEICDFDGDYEAICLRILSRWQESYRSKLPLSQVERAFKMSRESRKTLIDSLRSDDRYSFTYVNQLNEVHTALDPQEICKDPEVIDAKMEKTKLMVITDEHVKIFGETLNELVGLSVEEAFEKVNN